MGLTSGYVHVGLCGASVSGTYIDTSVHSPDMGVVCWCVAEAVFSLTPENHSTRRIH